MSTDQKRVVREQLKNISEDEYLRAHTKVQLEEKANILGADLTEAKTKPQIYAAMVAVADLPDPSLRGTSTVESPVAQVWQLADEMFAEAAAAGKEPPRRKDVVEAARKIGVAYYTARTQYQAWFARTDRGRRRLSELTADELPQVLKPEVEEEAAAS